MSKFFNLKIIDPEKTIYEGKVSSLIVPSALGYLGILADHAPLMAYLKSGKVTFKEEQEKTQTLSLKEDGFIEVINNNATILTK